jgi:hypothetical protein
LDERTDGTDSLVTVKIKHNEEHKKCQVPVAHTFNPSYSGGRDQEDCGLKTAQGNS